jgi:hypothetical protein
VTHFKVVGHKGRTGVLIVKIGSKRDETQDTGNSMAEYRLPVPEVTIGEPILVRQSSKDGIRVPNTEGYSWGRDADKWDGKADYCSWYA